jgi:peptide/nickel transport system substrate-binding protein
VLPPALAATFEGGEFAVLHHRSADYRTVTMPSSHPVTGDPAIRKALNLAVNRQGMIDALLTGKGVPASTPVPAVLASYVEPAAQFRHDPAEAGRILDAAGWVLGADGIRARNGQPARFTLMYPTTDTVRKDLAQAVVSDAKAVGIEVVLEGLGWEAIEPRLAQDSLVMGGGSQLDPDQVIYPLLHSSFGGDGFNNPGSYRNAEVDAGLEAARRATDPAEQIAAVKSWQRAYAADPGFVFLVFLDHSYVMRQKWNGYTPVVDPHSHGVLTWGALWNFEDWTPKR